METVTHPIPPLFDASSRILILGSFPSVKSREGLFFIIIPRTVSGRYWPESLRNRCPAPLRKRKYSC